MNHAVINKYCRKFGFEIHGIGYLQRLAKKEFQKEVFLIQKDILKQ